MEFCEECGKSFGLSELIHCEKHGYTCKICADKNPNHPKDDEGNYACPECVKELAHTLAHGVAVGFYQGPEALNKMTEKIKRNE